MEEILKEVDNSSENTEEKKVTKLPFDFILEKLYETSQKFGQIIFVDENEDNSKSISIIRLLSDNSKQLFKVTLEETSELKIKQ